MSEKPTIDTESALSFLEWHRPEGPWALTLIPQEGGGTRTKTFTPAERDAMRDWLRRENAASQNVYYMVNLPAGPIRKKASKSEVEAVEFLHVDVDPRVGEEIEKERALILERIRSFEPAPSIIVDSGGGYQALWRLDEPFYVGGKLSRAEDAEAFNRTIETKLDGDHCHNVERIFRLPGTINWPNDKKRAAGREPRAAAVAEHRDASHPLAAFDSTPRANQPPAPQYLERKAPVRISTTDELEEWGVAEWARATIVQGHYPEEPARWGGDRSRAVWAVACELARQEVPPEVSVGILTDPDLAIAEHVRDQSRPLEYAWRQVEKAVAKAENRSESFATTEDGKVLANHQGNIRLALRKLEVELRHDTFANRSVVAGLDGHGPHLDDAALTRLWLEIDDRFRFRPQIDFFHRVVMDGARNATFHPVCDYLDGLDWDGEQRLDRWLTIYGGAEDTEYTRAVGRIALIAAVRRVRQPGAKYDEMLTLEGVQGTNKSSALRLLAIRDEWFGDDLPLNADGKKVIEQTAGKWIIEAGELKGMRKGEVEALKSFLSRQDDTARLSYARLPEVVRRQFVVVGTTNSERYLRDPTGNRRFWPVAVDTFDLDALRRDRDQLWAEAAAHEGEGASIRLDPSLYDAAGLEQEARRSEDPLVATLADILGSCTGKVRTADVWSLLGIPTAQRTQEMNVRLGDSMRELGWERVRRRFGGDRPEYAYVRGDKVQRQRRIAVSLGASGWTVDEAASAPGGVDDELPY